MAQIPQRTQGGQLPDLTLTWTDEDGNTRTLSGTLTGNMTDVNTSVTTAIAGTLTADADQVTNKGQFTWDFAAADVATAGEYSVYFIETVSGEDYKSDMYKWVIVTAPTA